MIHGRPFRTSGYIRTGNQTYSSGDPGAGERPVMTSNDFQRPSHISGYIKTGVWAYQDIQLHRTPPLLLRIPRHDDSSSDHSPRKRHHLGPVPHIWVYQDRDLGVSRHHSGYTETPVWVYQDISPTLWANPVEYLWVKPGHNDDSGYNHVMKRMKSVSS